MQTNPAVEQNKNMKWSAESPWNSVDQSMRQKDKRNITCFSEVIIQEASLPPRAQRVRRA